MKSLCRALGVLICICMAAFEFLIVKDVQVATFFIALGVFGQNLTWEEKK